MDGAAVLAALANSSLTEIGLAGTQEIDDESVVAAAQGRLGTTLKKLDIRAATDITDRALTATSAGAARTHRPKQQRAPPRRGTF